MLPSQPQRVALAKSAKGEPVYIEREWLKAFQELGGGTSGVPVDLAALQALVASLLAQLTTLQAEVTQLKQGYQI